MRHILTLAIALLALAWPSYAQDATEDAGTTEDSRMIYPRNDESAESREGEAHTADELFSSSSTSSMLLSLLGFTLLLGACAVGAWYLFKRGLLKRPFSRDEGKLKIAESRMLGNRQFLMVVEYEDNKILLGVGPGKIDYLTSLNTYRNEFPSLESQPEKKLSELR